MSDLSIAELKRLKVDGIPIGMHAWTSTLRHYASGTLEPEPDAHPVLSRFAEAALLTARATARLFRERGTNICVLHHGIYVPQGVIADVAKSLGIRVVTWATGYRPNSFIFSHDDTYHRTMLDEVVETWAPSGGMVFGDAEHRAIDAYMEQRINGRGDWITYQSGPAQANSNLRARLGLDDRPIIALYTNVLWDAQIFYPSNAYPTLLAWLMDTIARLGERTDLQLVVRIHPAEVKNPMRSRQQAVAEIARVFPVLPANVRVIAPEDPLNSYELARSARAALIYGTKIGLELAYLGVPTVVAGEAWIRGKGLTFDATTRDEYLALLDRLPDLPYLNEAAIEAARRYAYHFFFRRMIPLGFVTRKPGWPPFELAATADKLLRPGADLGVDVVCRGILEGAPFVFPTETLSDEKRLHLPGPSSTY